ncbi:MAG: 30S ribosomal protein S8e [Candidatus Diapherotrites archaeon]
MTQWHEKSKRKTSGGISYTRRRSDKRLAWRGGVPAQTTISEKPKVDVFRTRGGGTKQALLSALEASIVDKSGKTSKKGKILAVVENNADRHFARRNVITKGAILKVEISGTQKYARVTSKPGQSGSIDAVLIDGYIEKKEEKAKKAKKAENREKAAKKEGRDNKAAEHGKTPEKAVESAEN